MSISCRGKNGWFELRGAKVGTSGPMAYLGFFSKTPYVNMPPIYFEGNRKEILAMLDGLRAAVAKHDDMKLTLAYGAWPEGGQDAG